MAAAIAASGSVWSIPSPSSSWWASRVAAFAFSGVLVQAAVQAAGAVGVSPCGLSLTTVSPLLPKLEVAGSTPVSRS